MLKENNKYNKHNAIRTTTGFKDNLNNLDNIY